MASKNTNWSGLTRNNYHTKNSHIQNFSDFDKKEEKKELKKVRRSFTKNDDEVYELPNNSKFKFNSVTHKMEDDFKELIDDKIDAIEESKMNESHIDDKVLLNIKKTEAYKTLSAEFSKSVDKFTKEINKIADSIGYDEGDSDHNMAFNAAVQEALDNHIGY